jgi:hypothetical protein
MRSYLLHTEVIALFLLLCVVLIAVAGASSLYINRTPTSVLPPLALSLCVQVYGYRSLFNLLSRSPNSMNPSRSTYPKFYHLIELILMFYHQRLIF